jgi:hypothetical protein
MPDNPSYFLVQISIMGFYSLFNEKKYINNRWTVLKKDADQRSIKTNDVIILYFTGKVPVFKYQIKYVFKVTNVSIDKNEVKLKLFFEIKPLTLENIRENVKNNILSNKFLSCGLQGFNIIQIDLKDFEVISSKKTNKSDFYRMKNILVQKIDFSEDFEAKSNINLLHTYRNNLNDLPKKRISILKKLGFITIINDAVKLTKKGTTILKDDSLSSL